MCESPPKFEYFDYKKNGYPIMCTGVERPQCNIVEVNSTSNDPDNLVYYCKNIMCGKYHKIYSQDDLLYAIYYMEADRVKKLLRMMTLEDIENVKVYNRNILDYIIYSLLSITGQRTVPTLDNIWGDSFTSPYYKNNPIEILKCKKYLELLDVVCERVPYLIEEKHFSSINKSNYSMLNVLNNYFQKEDGDSKCYICFGSYSSELINSICKCKTTKVHISCLIKTVKEFGDVCSICNENFNARVDSRNRIFFPFSNLYWDQLGSIVHVVPVDDITESLRFSTSYLVKDRVKQILEQITDEEFIVFKNQFKKVPKQAKFYISFKFDKDDYLMMTPYPSSNMNCEKYPELHREINNLFKDRENKINK